MGDRDGEGAELEGLCHCRLGGPRAEVALGPWQGMAVAQVGNLMVGVPYLQRLPGGPFPTSQLQILCSAELPDGCRLLSSSGQPKPRGLAEPPEADSGPWVIPADNGRLLVRERIPSPPHLLSLASHEVLLAHTVSPLGF